MKKLVFLTVCLVAFAANGFSQRGYKGEQGVSSVGVIMGHAINNKAFTVGADYRYNILNNLRLSPSALYVLKNDDMSSLYLNADAHYLARITNEITIYPIGGLGVSVLNYDKTIFNNLEEYYPDHPLAKSDTKVRFGLNLGFGGEMRASKDIIVGAEFRYNLTSERVYDQAMLLARVAYYF